MDVVLVGLVVVLLLVSSPSLGIIPEDLKDRLLPAVPSHRGVTMTVAYDLLLVRRRRRIWSKGIDT